eukprot:CAMPEP_0198140890 /NCGR_PEP_ID=MMETSP1443-20131203/3980_1 /TAXON_ID=186043 /ORGANISM="Entomoneis sp., Strain CCMP2396" /LENGTH=555 /DNA_ID=CAMNT_0043803459 /DNA_START=37 /DNA_END=1701 /DNA_ORIENTATION=-
MTSPSREEPDTDVSAMDTAIKMRESSPVVRFATPRTIEKVRERAFAAAAGLDDQSRMSINQSMASVSYTPIMTPNRSGDIVLLSPSRTIAETLKSLATVTGQQLEEVWDEVGYSPEDRASQLNDLIVKFRDLCEQKISEERGVAETFSQTINEAKEEMQQLTAALQIPFPGDISLEHEQQSTLSDELAHLEIALDDLRVTASQALEDLQECRDFLIEAHEALGVEMNPKWIEIGSDLTMGQREKFHEKKAEMKSELSTRTSAIIQLVRDCQHLMRDLKMEAESDSASEIDKRIAGSLVRSKDDSFMMASKHRTDTCIGIDNIAMEELTKRVSELHVEKRRRKTRLQEMGLEIAKLWEKLRVPEDEQMTFTESVRGLGIDTLKKGETELQRLHAIKTEMIGQLIEEARQGIKELWDQIDAEEEYRSSFQAFCVNDENAFDDNLLEAHEAYLGKLHNRYEQRKPILRLIERREGIVKERMEYENLQKDPERLKQRSGALARQLLEEEKMARRIKRELPKLTNALKEKLTEWKERHSEDFLHQKAIYLDEISRQEEDW